MKKILLAVCLLWTSSLATAQQPPTEVLKPLLVDKAVLSGVGLKKIDLKDEPEKDFYQKMLYRGEDLSVFVVSTETWNNPIKSYAFDEYVYLLHGQSIVKPLRGNSQIFQTGDHLFVPKGFEGAWEIRAGDHWHYELSVITTQRAAPTAPQSTFNARAFDRSVLSGAQISLQTTYQEILQQGAELTVTLKAEKPTERTITTPMKEQLVHLCAGQLTLTDLGQQTHTYYTGDFFILPKGFKGT